MFYNKYSYNSISVSRSDLVIWLAEKELNKYQMELESEGRTLNVNWRHMCHVEHMQL